MGAESATAGQAGSKSISVPTGQNSVDVGNTCWARFDEHSHRVVLVRQEAAEGDEGDTSCIVRSTKLTEKAVGLDCLRPLDAGVFPRYPERGSPANSAPAQPAGAAKFLLG
eukprot:SAG11_NODE_140_length_15009_cov_7.342522_10_plen_111_part_00